LRPGQRAADITAAAPRLALALGAAGLEVTNRDAGWVTIMLIDPQDECANGFGGIRNGGAGNGPRLPELHAA
jgi:hypothetical protein